MLHKHQTGIEDRRCYWVLWKRGYYGTAMWRTTSCGGEEELALKGWSRSYLQYKDMGPERRHMGQAQAGRRLWVRPGSLEKFGGNRERVNVAGANLQRTWNPKPGVGTLIHISPSCLRNQLSPSEAGCSSSRRWVWDHWWSLQWNTPVGTRTALTHALL